jgi:hypothetical protein
MQFNIMANKRFGKFLNCPVDQRTRAAVEQLADNENTTLSEIVRKLLTDALAQRDSNVKI